MAKTADIISAIKKKFGDVIVEEDAKGKFPHVVVEAAHVKALCEWLIDDDAMAFDFLASLAGVDKGDRFEVVYVLFSYLQRHSIGVKTRVPRAEPEVESVASIWPAADWYERETYDMLGIVFKGHPNLRRLLLPDDWEGFPLRKDYKYPDSYDGITLRRDEECWPDPGDKELYK